MRELLRDYVLILANTGMRHGTEALNLKWRDVEWITKNGERYIQFTVNGKTGKRTLIARHNAEDYLKRIQARFDDLGKLEFDALLKKRLDTYVFRLRTGERTNAPPCVRLVAASPMNAEAPNRSATYDKKSTLP